MMTEELKISQKDMRLILSAASPDAALVYLYIKSGNALGAAAGDLHLSESRLGCAEATLRQLGLLADDRVSRIAPGERPGYSERDVLEAMDGDAGFRGLYGEGSAASGPEPEYGGAENPAGLCSVLRHDSGADFCAGVLLQGPGTAQREPAQPQPAHH